MSKPISKMTLIVVVVLLAACGDAPFLDLGHRSSDWIGEPTVTTTTVVVTTLPTAVGSQGLTWFNDDIETGPLDDPGALQAAIFQRRSGDQFIQASRAEIAALLPDLEFPATSPYLAEYVTSQLVFENDGSLASDPTVAFGIWSSEPYTRSRSVAQMVVLRVSEDEEGATAAAEPDADLSCARYAERTTEVCDTLELGGKPMWSLSASNGTTLIWYGGKYRYELFGRSFVTGSVLEEMASDTVPLSELATGPG